MVATGQAQDRIRAREEEEIFWAGINFQPQRQTTLFGGAIWRPCVPAARQLRAPGSATWRCRVPQPASLPASSADTWQLLGTPLKPDFMLPQPVVPINNSVFRRKHCEFWKVLKLCPRTYARYKNILN